MALGEMIGQAVVRTINFLDSRDFVLFEWSQGHNIHMEILGDPTLRLYRIRSPQGLEATPAEGEVQLDWAGAPHPVRGFFVYRSTDGYDGPFELLNEAPVNVTELTDPAAPSGDLLYQVRATEPRETGSGIFTNLSQGTFVEVTVP